MSGTRRMAWTVPIHPCLHHHRFQGRAVLPAVEAMQTLAAAVQRETGQRLFTIRNARFDKFLHLPSDAGQIETLVEITPSGGDWEAVLLTRHRAPRSGITRLKTHAAMVFCEADRPENDPLSGLPAALPEAAVQIPAVRIYQDLVPFDSAYRNIRDCAWIWPEGAMAPIVAPRHDTPPGPLGSPFPLDAAFHAACVWGQRFAGVVAFPVGLNCRRVRRPLQPGERCVAWVFPRRTDPDLLLFDIALSGADGALREWVNGTRMRDVSGGRLRPPEWIQAPAT